MNTTRPQLPESLEMIQKSETFHPTRHRWNTNEEIASILIGFDKHEEWLSKEVKVRPKSGTMILYSRKRVRYRRDGYCWKKRKDGKTTREDHMKLKVQGTECIYGCYVHSAILPTFHRRCYWLLQNPDIVLVHYLNVPYTDDNKIISPTLNFSSISDGKKEWTRDELISELKPMFFSENDPDLANELDLSTTESLESIVQNLMVKQRSRVKALQLQEETSDSSPFPSSTRTFSSSSAARDKSQNESQRGGSAFQLTRQGSKTLLVTKASHLPGASGGTACIVTTTATTSSNNTLGGESNTSISDSCNNKGQVTNSLQLVQLNTSNAGRSTSTSSSTPAVIGSTSNGVSSGPFIFNLSHLQNGNSTVLILNSGGTVTTAGGSTITPAGLTGVAGRTSTGGSSTTPVTLVYSNGIKSSGDQPVPMDSSPSSDSSSTASPSSIQQSMSDSVLKNPNSSSSSYFMRADMNGNASTFPAIMDPSKHRSQSSNGISLLPDNGDDVDKNTLGVSASTNNGSVHPTSGDFVGRSPSTCSSLQRSNVNSSNDTNNSGSCKRSFDVTRGSSSSTFTSSFLHQNGVTGMRQEGQQQQSEEEERDDRKLSLHQSSSSQSTEVQDMDFIESDMPSPVDDLFNLESFDMMTDSFPNLDDFHSFRTSTDHHHHHQGLDNLNNNNNNSTGGGNTVSCINNNPISRGDQLNQNTMNSLNNQQHNLHHNGNNMNHMNGNNNNVMYTNGSRNTDTFPDSNMTHSITDYSPEWSYPEGGMKVLVTGPWFSPSHNYSIIFDGIGVATSLVQNGVLRCFSPAHEPGFVSLQVAIDGNPVSNSVIFEYREHPSTPASSTEDYFAVDDNVFKFCLLERLELLESHVSVGQRSGDGGSRAGGGRDGPKECESCHKNRTFEDRLIAMCSHVMSSPWLPCNVTTVTTQSLRSGSSHTDMSLLHLSAALGYYKLIRFLIRWRVENPSIILEVEVDAFSFDANECTPLMWAVARGHREAALLLLRWNKGALNLCNKQGLSPITIGKKRGFESLVKDVEQLQKDLLSGVATSSLDDIINNNNSVPLSSLHCDHLSCSSSAAVSASQESEGVINGSHQQQHHQLHEPSGLQCNHGFLSTSSSSRKASLSRPPLPSPSSVFPPPSSCQNRPRVYYCPGHCRDSSSSLSFIRKSSSCDTGVELGFDSDTDEDDDEDDEDLEVARNCLSSQRNSFGNSDCPNDILLDTNEQVLSFAEHVIAAIPDRIKSEVNSMDSEAYEVMAGGDSDDSGQVRDDFSSLEFSDMSYRSTGQRTPNSSPSSSYLHSPGSMNTNTESPSPPPSTADLCEFFSSTGRIAMQKEFSSLTLSDQEQRELYEAAKTIQKAYRVYKGRKRQEQEKERQAAILIQSYYRRYRQYIYYKQMTRAAQVIQHQFRNYCSKRFKKSCQQSPSTSTSTSMTSSSSTTTGISSQSSSNGCNSLRSNSFSSASPSHSTIASASSSSSSVNKLMSSFYGLSDHQHQNERGSTDSISFGGLKRTYSQRRQHQAARKIQQFLRQSKNKLQRERALALQTLQVAAEFAESHLIDRQSSATTEVRESNNTTNPCQHQCPVLPPSTQLSSVVTTQIVVHQEAEKDHPIATQMIRTSTEDCSLFASSPAANPCDEGKENGG